MFQTIYRYFKRISKIGNGNYIYYWKSKGLSDERINSIKTSNHSITPNFSYYGIKTRVEFNGSCLKQDKVKFNFILFQTASIKFPLNHGKVVNMYIVHEIRKSINIGDYLALENCLFGAVTLTKNSGIDKYKYSGHGITFYGHGYFSFPGTTLGKNVII